MKIKFKIIFSYVICHLISYFILSLPYYHFVMKKYYVGENAVFQKFLITENNPELWKQVLQYILPAQILSAVLFASILVLVFDWLKNHSKLQSFFFLFWLKTILSGFLSISPAPGSLEGILFFLPEITLSIHSLVIIEMVFQGVIVSYLFILLNLKIWKQSE